MVTRRYFVLAVAFCAALNFAGCANSPQARLQSAPSNAASHSQQSSSGPCTTPPVQALQVTANSLSLSVGGTATFVACTQFAGDFSITSSPSGMVSVPTSVTPIVDPNTGIKKATITVTGTGPGRATITVTDKGNAATVAAVVSGPWQAWFPQQTTSERRACRF